MIQGEIGHGDGVVGAVSVWKKETRWFYFRSWINKEAFPTSTLPQKEWRKNISSGHFKSEEVTVTMMMMMIVTYGVIGGKVVPPHAGAGRAAAVLAPLQGGHGGRQSPRTTNNLCFCTSTAHNPTPFTLELELACISHLLLKKIAGDSKCLIIFIQV